MSVGCVGVVANVLIAWLCFGEKLRFRAPELVVDEMEYLEKEKGVREIVFFDETFTIGKRRMKKFLRYMQGTKNYENVIEVTKEDLPKGKLSSSKARGG